MLGWASSLRGGSGWLALLAFASAAAPHTEATPAGSLDRSFGDDGRKLTDVFGGRDRANDVAIQPDGKILVAGSARKPGRGELMTLARYERSGRLDRNFGARGFVTVRRIGGEPSASRGAALGLQGNGKIVVAGDDADLVVARFRRNGRLDPSFGHGGKVQTNLFGLNQAEDLAIQPDGKIVVVGHTRAAAGGLDFLVIARYNRDGRLDSSFGDGGAVLTRLGTDVYARAHGVALQPDGKIVVSGELGNGFIVARFLANGSPDTGFGNENGFQDSQPFGAGIAYDLAVLPDGRILAAGTVLVPQGGTFGLARYLSDGSPDPQFGDEGGVRTTFGQGRMDDGATALASQQDGRIIVSGVADGFAQARFALARYRAKGDLDSSFSGDGKVRVGFRRRPPTPHDDLARAVATTPKRRIVVAGNSQARSGDDFALARFHGTRH